MSLRDKWNARYAQLTDAPEAAQILRDYRHLLPAQGQALDLACGRGGNALLLAASGLQVDAWDISDVAIEKLRLFAHDAGLPVNARVHDVEQQPPSALSYDVIVVSYFLYRPLMQALVAALRPGGLLFYQTFTRERVSQRGPGNDVYRLGNQELLALLGDLKPVLYREEGRLGDISQGFRDEAMYIGLKNES